MFPIPFPDDHFRKPPQPDPPTDLDRRLASVVSQRLASVLEAGTRHVSVDVQNRVVLLDGTVDSAATAEAIAGLAWDVPDVIDVRNSLTWPSRPRRGRTVG